MAPMAAALRGRRALAVAAACAGAGAAFLGYLTLDEEKSVPVTQVPAGEKSVPMSQTHLPKEINWLAKGAVTTPALNQKQSEGCWAYAGVSAVEGAHQIATGVLETLSPQCVLDCAVRSLRGKTVKGQGCTGGVEHQVYAYAKEHGLNRLSDYPLNPYRLDSICLAAGKPIACRISGWAEFDVASEEILMEHLARQPIPIGVDDFPLAANFKGGHVIEIDEWPPAKEENQRDIHTVLVIAYGEDGEADGKWWYIKDSRDLGKDGFAYLRRGIPGTEGVGGMLRGYTAFYPLIPSSDAKSGNVDGGSPNVLQKGVEILEAERMEQLVTEWIQQKLQEVDASMQQDLAGAADHVNFAMQKEFFKCAHGCYDRRRTKEEIISCVENCSIPVTKASNAFDKEATEFQKRLHHALVVCQEEYEAAKLQKMRTDATQELESCVKRCFDDSFRDWKHVMERIHSTLD